MANHPVVLTLASVGSGRAAVTAVDVVMSDRSRPLADTSNVIYTPYIRGRIVETIHRIGMAAAEEVLFDVVYGDRPRRSMPPTPEGVR